MNTETNPILIVGANGKTGYRVNARLQSLGYSTRAVSRSTDPAFNWHKPETWPDVLKGTKSAYVTYQPDLAVPQAESAIKNFIQLAKDYGLEHIVLLSGRGEEGAQRAENVLINSGLQWNIVRCGWFSQNFSESFMIDGILSGELILPADDTLEPFVDADDIAEVTVATLLKPVLRNRVFELTGPEALTFAQCVETISQALHRPIQFTSIPVDDYIDALNAQGVDEDYQWLLRELFTNVFDGRNSQVMQGVEEALGRPATDFQTYVAKTMASGAWTIAEEKEATAC